VEIQICTEFNMRGAHFVDIHGEAHNNVTFGLFSEISSLLFLHVSSSESSAPISRGTWDMNKIIVLLHAAAEQVLESKKALESQGYSRVIWVAKEWTDTTEKSIGREISQYIEPLLLLRQNDLSTEMSIFSQSKLMDELASVNTATSLFPSVQVQPFETYKQVSETLSSHLRACDSDLMTLKELLFPLSKISNQVLQLQIKKEKIQKENALKSQHVRIAAIREIDENIFETKKGHAKASNPNPLVEILTGLLLGSNLKGIDIFCKAVMDWYRPLGEKNERAWVDLRTQLAEIQKEALLRKKGKTSHGNQGGEVDETELGAQLGKVSQAIRFSEIAPENFFREIRERARGYGQDQRFEFSQDGC
jgi:hypothetical protein